MQDMQIEPPWYRQLWPWILIALPTSAVIACGITVWLVIQNPEHTTYDAPPARVNAVLGSNSVVPPKE